MYQITVFKMIRVMVNEYLANGRWGTAHIYRSASNAFESYMGYCDLSFADLSAHVIKGFEIYLRRRENSWNTVATYMKVLNAAYNRAVECGASAYTPRLFAHVRTAVDSSRKRSLEAGEIGELILINKSPETAMERVRLIFSLMFMLRGIPFVDLCYLRKTDVKDCYLTYRRRKTGRAITVKLTEEAQQIIDFFAAETSLDSPYMFPFIVSPEGSREAYKEYQRALRHFNHQLQRLSDVMPIDVHLSTYTARHTWATMAYYCEIHHGIISEAMGHSSIAVTETYLKPFCDERIDNANNAVISYVKHRGRKMLKKRSKQRKWSK